MTDVDPRIERTRERVFDATVALLREEGIDGVTHSRVAEAAGVGRATVYRHWPDLTALLVDALVRQRDALHGWPDDLEGRPLRDVIEAMARAGASMMREDPLFTSMLALLERADRDEAYTGLRRGLADAIATPLDAVLTAAQERGELPADFDRVRARATLAGPILFARLVLGTPFTDEQLAAHVDAWFRAMDIA